MMSPGSVRPHRAIIACAFAVLLVAQPLHAQPEETGSPLSGPTDVQPSIRPVLTESQRDGLLLGLDFRLGVGPWKLQVGGAHGLSSRVTRFKTGIAYQEVMELTYGDWPTSLVRGREGEQGFRLSADLIALYRWLGGRQGGLLGEILKGSRLRGTGFLGRLWPGAEETGIEGPPVRYGHLSSFLHLPLPLGATLQTQGELLYGHPLEMPERSFRTFFSSSRLWIDRTRLELRMGSLENPAGLSGFRFDLGLRSYPATFKGHRILLASLEREHELITTHLFPLDLSSILRPLGSIPVRLHLLSSVFFEGGIVFGAVESPAERENTRSTVESAQLLFGWGISLRLPDLDVRVDLGINREGSPRLSLVTGVLP